MTELNHETFDLGAAIAGVDFPEKEVTIYFQESIGFQVFEAENELRLAEIRGNEERLKEVDALLGDLKEKARGAAYKVTLRGVPEATRKACDHKAREEFPVEYSFIGQATPNPDRDDKYNTLLWAASIIKVTDPQGVVAIPTEEDIIALRGSVGRNVVSTITRGLEDLVNGTKAGFESAAQDVDFLSDASPEG